MNGAHNYLLWEDNNFIIRTPLNPHQPYSEGMHLVVAPKQEVPQAWENSELSAQTFKLAADACKIIESLQLAPWFNIQANGNWGLLPGAEPFFHIHIYGRNKSSRWGKPIILPEAPKTYQNEPMPEEDREKLTKAFREKLSP